MQTKQISVIVPTYNRPQLLARTLASIKNQSYSNIQTIIVNDAGENVRDVVASFANPWKEFRYFENEENLGLAGTRNVGMEKATGDYFVFLDDDDILLEYALEFRMSMIEKLNAEIVYTRALRDIWEKKPQGYISIGKNLYWDSNFDKDLILIQNIAPCCCPLFSRKAWVDSGYYRFDENLDTSEDFDFWVALSRKNYFHELKLIDAECSHRRDLTQMTGSRDFSKAYPVIYKRWRKTAENMDWVVEHQNAMLVKMGMKPEDYGL